MSGTNSGPTPPEKPFHEGPTKAGRLSRLKRVGWITFATALSAMVVITLFALVSAKSGSGLIISLDYKAGETHFTMGLQPRTGGSGSGADSSGAQEQPSGDRALIGEPLGRASLAEHQEIKKYYDAKIGEIENSEAGTVNAGSWNYVGLDRDGKEAPLALFYTFYLNNTSETETQKYGLFGKLNTNLTSNPEALGRRPYDYVRLGVYIGDYGQPDDTYRIFANTNTKRLGTDYDGVKNKTDYRECLAKTTSNKDYVRDGEGKIVKDENGFSVIDAEYRTPLYTSNFNGNEIAFCEEFDLGADGMGLFDVRDTIDPGKSRRITFFAYLEGEDPDSYNGEPINQSLGFTLSVGVPNE